MRVAVMSHMDMIGFTVCSTFIGLQMAKEWFDIELCTLALRDAGDNIDKNWKYVLKAMNFVRRYMFLPSVVAMIPILVVAQGSDAMSICFNTVAVVFLCELDDNCFAVTIPKEVQARVAATCRSTHLDEAEAKIFQFSKNVLVVSVAGFLPICLAVWGNADYFLHFVFSLFLSWLAFAPCEIAQILGTSTTKSKAQVAVLIALELLKVLVMPPIWLLSVNILS
jgi:hypothetical protein